MKGKITVVFGLVLMLAGLLWYAAILREDSEAAQAVQKLVPQLQQAIIEPSVPDTVPEETQIQQVYMTEIMVDGIGYVGVLGIPALSLELPVISNWSKENAKTAPCRYSGSIYQDDFIICAHNYDSHFGKLNRLNAGDMVTFQDLDGNVFRYQVKDVQILEGTDVEKMQAGDWDLTLFTCTPGGKMRYCVRCSMES